MMAWGWLVEGFPLYTGYCVLEVLSILTGQSGVNRIMHTFNKQVNVQFNSIQFNLFRESTYKYSKYVLHNNIIINQ